MANNNFYHFTKSAPHSFTRPEDIIKEEDNREYKYELYDITAIKTENQQCVEQEISTEQIYQFPTSKYGLQLVNNNSDCTLICDENGDSQVSSKFQNELPPNNDFFSPCILRTTPFKIPSMTKQTDVNRQKLEYNSAFKPVHHQYHNFDKEIIQIDNNRQCMEYSSAFKPVYHLTQHKTDEVQEIDTIQQKMKYNSAFKPVLNSSLCAANETKEISDSRHNLGYSSAFKPVCHSMQNNSDKITGIDYKRIRLNENIPSSYQGENGDNFLNSTTVQPINRNISQSSTVSNNDIAALLMRQIEAIETTNKLLKEIILTKYNVLNKENGSMDSIFYS